MKNLERHEIIEELSRLGIETRVEREAYIYDYMEYLAENSMSLAERFIDVVKEVARSVVS